VNNARDKIVLFIWLVSIGLLVTYLFSQLKIVSDIGQFMPVDNQDPQLQALMNELKNGSSATTLMIRLFDADSSALSKISTQLHHKLGEQKKLFREVRNGQESFELSDFETIYPYRYLLSEKTHWSSDVLRINFERRISELRTGVGAMTSELILSDPQLVFIKYLRGLLDINQPLKKHGVWFDKNQEDALMIISVQSEALDLDVMQLAIEQVRLSFSELSSESTAKLDISGPGIMAVETRKAIEQVMQHMTQFMSVLIVVVFLVAYRSVRAILLALIPLLTAILVSLSVTQIMFGDVHSIVLVFGITLLGVGLDYPLHFFSHLRNNEVASESLERIWPTLRLSGISSILAFFALMGSGFEGLSQLAVFASSGLLVALFMTRFVLPNWVSADHIKPQLWALNVLPAISWGARQKILIGSCLLVIPLWLIIQQGFNWETSIHAISPVPASAREKDQIMRNELNVADISHVFMYSSYDVNDALKTSEKIAQQLVGAQEQGIIRSIWSPSQVLPSIERQRQRQSALPTEQELTQSLQVALKTLPFKSQSFKAWATIVADSAELKPLLYEDIQLTPLAEILRQGLFKNNDQWFSVVRIGGVQSTEALNRWLNERPDLKQKHIVIREATEHLLVDYRNATFERLLVVFFILLVMVMIWSRSVVRGLRILLPVSIGLLASVATPLVLGIGINVFHLLALLLVLGLGLDYSLFFNRADSDRLQRQQNLHAISISALTSSAAFLVLAFSSVPVLAGMGQIVSVGVLMCFISSWLLS